MWYAGTADAVYQNIDIIESYGPEYIVILAGDHIYKMDYELMLQQHVEPKRRRDRRLHRGAAHGGDGLRRDGGRRDRPHHLVPRKAEGSARHARTSPDMALASMGIYVFDTQFLFDQLRRDAADPNSSRDFGKDIIPHHRASTAKRSRTASRSPACARTPRRRPIGATSARSTPTGRRTSTSPTSLPALDLYDRDWPIWTYARDHAAGEVRPRRGRPARRGGRFAGLGRLHRLRAPRSPLAAVHRRARAFLSRRSRTR